VTFRILANREEEEDDDRAQDDTEIANLETHAAPPDDKG